MRVIGYLRVSTADQDLANCKNQILHFANEKRLGSVTWIEETVSGTVDWKQRELGKVLHQLSPGDVVITAEPSRFARSLRQIIEVVEYCKLHQITLHSIKGSWTILKVAGRLSWFTFPIPSYSRYAQTKRGSLSFAVTKPYRTHPGSVQSSGDLGGISRKQPITVYTMFITIEKSIEILKCHVTRENGL